MYQLYAAPGAASLCVHWMLLELQQPFELRLLDTSKQEQKSPEYLKLNPDGRIPTLVVDGKPHAETAALLMLLAERHPEAGLAPAAGSATRADYLQWTLWLANTLMPAFRSWFYPEEAAGSAHAEASKAQSRSVIEACWQRLDGRFADGRAYLLGDTMCATDLLLTMLMRWSRNMPRTAESWTHLAAYGERQRARPALQEVHRREGLTEWIDTGGVRTPRDA
jgi:glutathione S-transferase